MPFQAELEGEMKRKGAEGDFKEFFKEFAGKTGDITEKYEKSRNKKFSINLKMVEKGGKISVIATREHIKKFNDLLPEDDKNIAKDRKLKPGALKTIGVMQDVWDQNFFSPKERDTRNIKALAKGIIYRKRAYVTLQRYTNINIPGIGYGPREFYNSITDLPGTECFTNIIALHKDEDGFPVENFCSINQFLEAMQGSEINPLRLEEVNGFSLGKMASFYPLRSHIFAEKLVSGILHVLNQRKNTQLAIVLIAPKSWKNQTKRLKGDFFQSEKDFEGLVYDSMTGKNVKPLEKRTIITLKTDTSTFISIK